MRTLLRAGDGDDAHFKDDEEEVLLICGGLEF